MNILLLVLSLVMTIIASVLFMLLRYKNNKRNPQDLYQQQSNPTIIKNPDTTSLVYCLQAYERLILFVERMYPPQLVLKIYNANFKVKEMQALLNETIQKEYEHNITQQIYVNHKIWKLMINIKDNHVLSINAIANACRDLSAAEYVKKIIEYYDINEIREQHLLLLDAIQQDAKTMLK